MATTFSNDMTPQELTSNAKFLHAFLECSDDIQVGIKEMLHIVFAQESDDQERHMALVTIADALYPSPHDGCVGMNWEESVPEAQEQFPELGQVEDCLDHEEAEFANRLRHAMLDRNMTQSQLAATMGIGQPAISNMLNRQCRPQRRTIERLADALGVTPSDLWSDLDSSK